MRLEKRARAYDGALVTWRQDKINEFEWGRWYIVAVSHEI